MYENNAMVVKKILSYISKISSLKMSSWTQFKLACGIINRAFEEINEKLESGDFLLDELLDETLQRVKSIDKDSHELDGELNEYANEIEKRFSKYLEKSSGPYYVGFYNYNHILNGLPNSIKIIGYSAIDLYTSKYIKSDGHLLCYSLAGLPQFNVKDFIPDILAEMQKHDILKSLYLYYCGNLTSILVTRLLNQAKLVVGKYASFADDFSKETQWDEKYKSLYIDSSDGNAIYFNREYGKDSVESVTIEGKEKGYRILLDLLSRGGIMFSVENTEDYIPILSTNLPEDFEGEKGTLDFSCLDELSKLLDSLFQSTLSINAEKTGKYFNMLESQKELHDRNKYFTQCQKFNLPDGKMFPTVQYTVDYWAYILTKLDKTVTYAQITEFRNQLETYLDEKLRSGQNPRIDPLYLNIGYKDLLQVLENTGIDVLSFKTNLSDILYMGVIKATETGVDKSEVVGKSWYDVVIPENIKKTFNYWLFVIERENAEIINPFELSILRPRFCHSMAEWIKNNPNQPVYIKKADVLSSYKRLIDSDRCDRENIEEFQHIFYSEIEIGNLENCDNYTITGKDGIIIYDGLEETDIKKNGF